MAALVDIVSGAVAGEIRVGLSQAPLTFPVQLADFTPATFNGYTDTPLQMTSQAPFVPGWGCCSGVASFTFIGDEPGVLVRSMWIIARVARVFSLVYVIDLAGTPAAVLRPGRNDLAVSLAAHSIVRGS